MAPFKIYEIIDWGEEFLSQHQQQNGSFLSVSSDSSSFKDGYTFPSLFSTTLILLSLADLKDTPKIALIKDKMANFLMSQKNENFSFNYWDRKSKEYKDIPYPDDLDDTFCALAALYKYDQHLFDGNTLRKITLLLTAMEEKVGGPYQTWIVKKDAPSVWKDIDLAVNSNIAYFLSLLDISLPNINALIESMIKNKMISSPYYPTIYPIIYFISRFYTGKHRDRLTKLLLKDYQQQNPLNQSLIILSLLNFNVSSAQITPIVQALTSHTYTSLEKPYPFYVGVNPKRDRKSVV